MRRRKIPRFQGENFAKNLELVEFIKEIAQEKSCEIGQIALAWVLAQSNNVVVIPGTTQEKYMLQNMEALDITLTTDELARIRAKLDTFEVTGTRYDENSMKLLDT